MTIYNVESNALRELVEADSVEAAIAIYRRDAVECVEWHQPPTKDELEGWLRDAEPHTITVVADRILRS